MLVDLGVNAKKQKSKQINTKMLRTLLGFEVWLILSCVLIKSHFQFLKNISIVIPVQKNKKCFHSSDDHIVSLKSN